MIKTEIKATIYLELTEEEAGCLDAICGYDHKTFLKVFKENMGEAYIKSYEKSIESLFKKCRGLLNEVKKLEKLREEHKFIKSL